MRYYLNQVVTYFSLSDCTLETQKKIEDRKIKLQGLTYHDLKFESRQLLIISDVSILEHRGEMKVLKSRH